MFSVIENFVNLDALHLVNLIFGKYFCCFDHHPPLSERPLSLPAYSPQSIKGVALTQELQNLLKKGAVEPAPPVSWFLQPSVPRPEGFGVVAPHHRPIDPERLRHLVSLPHGDSTVSPSLHPSGRLDDLPRPAGRLPAGSCSSRFASLPSVRGARQVSVSFNLYINALTLWVRWHLYGT